MSNSRSHYWPASVDEALTTLSWETPISVTWIDASQSSNVHIKKGKFANHNVETRVTSEGKFLAVQPGDSYNDVHILILKDISDGHRGTIQSIPLANVKEIINHALKQGHMIGNLKREVEDKKRRTWNKKIVKFADGSTKQFGGF